MSDEMENAPLPKFQRSKNRFGQEHGPYWTRVGKRKVSLKTEDYIKARERAREALYDGKTTWEDERFYDKTAPKETPVNGSNGTPLADWAADLASAASSVKPDEYRTPKGDTVPLLGSIPRDTPPPSDEPAADKPPTAPGEDSTELPPEMLEGMVRLLADMAVEAQIAGQEWMIRRFAKVEPGKIPASAFGRVEPAKLWEKQIRKWLPSDVPLPEWAVAMALCALATVPGQIANAQPLRTDVPKVD